MSDNIHEVVSAVWSGEGGIEVYNGIVGVVLLSLYHRMVINEEDPIAGSVKKIIIHEVVSTMWSRK